MWDISVEQPTKFIMPDPQDITHLFPKHVGIAQLVAGETCFVARDHDGAVWGWGRVNASKKVATENNMYDCGSMMGSRPFRIRIPCKAVDMCASNHEITILDEHGALWNMSSFGTVNHDYIVLVPYLDTHTTLSSVLLYIVVLSIQAFHLAPPVPEEPIKDVEMPADPSNPALASNAEASTEAEPTPTNGLRLSRLLSKVVKVAASKGVSACLDKDSNVYVWWPMSEEYYEKATLLPFTWELEDVAHRKDGFLSEEILDETIWRLTPLPRARGRYSIRFKRASPIIDIALASTFIAALCKNGTIFVHQLGTDPTDLANERLVWRQVSHVHRH